MSTIIVILAATLPIIVICDQDARNQLFNDNLGMDTMEILRGDHSIICLGFWREFSKFSFNFWLHGISH